MTLKITRKEYQLLDGSKKVLIQRVGDGSIVTRFDKTPPPIKPTDIVCPHFLELKWATGCPFNCAWCYLKGTLRNTPEGTKPHIKDFAKVQYHLEIFFSELVGDKELLNTGELADSLMWEKKDKPFSKFIIPLFEKQKRHRVLFVTKSKDIHNLLDLNPCEQVIISFSLNADSVAKRFEKGAPSVDERIKAASKLNKAGYTIRVRIDPLVPIPKWEKNYKRLIDEIFSNFIPERITIGSLRGLKSTIEEATDKFWIKYLREKSGWGLKIKLNTRYKMYHHLMSYLREAYNYNDIALCKETLEMWNSLGIDYKKIKCNCVL